MPRQTTLIPKAPVARIFKENGVPRVGNRALSRVVGFLTTRAEQAVAMSLEIAKHRGSRTVSPGDIELALKTGR